MDRTQRAAVEAAVEWAAAGGAFGRSIKERFNEVPERRFAGDGSRLGGHVHIPKVWTGHVLFLSQACEKTNSLGRRCQSTI
jgi:hypothetical protein